MAIALRLPDDPSAEEIAEAVRLELAPELALLGGAHAEIA